MGPAGADAPAIESRLSTLFDEVSPAVVSVVCYRPPVASQAEGPPSSDVRACRRLIASGAIIDPQGCVVTTDMVAQPGDSLVAHLSDGRQIPLVYQGSNEDLHIALLNLQGPGPFPYLARPTEPLETLPEWIAAIAYGPWRGRRPGEPALALAHRDAVEFARIPCGDSVAIAWRVMAPFLPGNGGGALVTLGGRWIGLIGGVVVSQGRAPLAAAGKVGGGPYESGIIVPAELVVDAVHAIRSCEAPEAPPAGFLGVSTARRPASEVDSLHRAYGVVVAEVLAGSPAARAGILAGDLILRFGTLPVVDAMQLTELVAATSPGTPVLFEVQRDGEARYIRVHMGDRASGEQAIAHRLRLQSEREAIRREIQHHLLLIRDLRGQLRSLEQRPAQPIGGGQTAVEAAGD
jgi:S1-C subfamily serine protease